MATSSLSSTSQVVKYQNRGCVCWTHSHRLSLPSRWPRGRDRARREMLPAPQYSQNSGWGLPPLPWWWCFGYVLAFRDLGGGSSGEERWSLLLYSSSNRCMATCCTLAAASTNAISCQNNWQQMALSNSAMKFIWTKKDRVLYLQLIHCKKMRFLVLWFYKLWISQVLVRIQIIS